MLDSGIAHEPVNKITFCKQLHKKEQINEFIVSTTVEPFPPPLLMYLTSQNPKAEKPRVLLQQHMMEFKKVNSSSSTAIQDLPVVYRKWRRVIRSLILDHIFVVMLQLKNIYSLVEELL